MFTEIECQRETYILYLGTYTTPIRHISLFVPKGKYIRYVENIGYRINNRRKLNLLIKKKKDRI